MKKIFFLIVLNTALANSFAQTRVISKIIIPLKAHLVLSHKDFTPAPPFHTYVISTTAEPAPGSLLFFKNQPLLNLRKPINRFLFLFTEFSFADVLEGTINSYKPGFVNTYDDHITELFKDAPSLVKIKCVIDL